MAHEPGIPPLMRCFLGNREVCISIKCLSEKGKNAVTEFVFEEREREKGEIFKEKKKKFRKKSEKRR